MSWSTRGDREAVKDYSRSCSKLAAPFAREAHPSRNGRGALQGRDRVPAIRGSRSCTCSSTEQRNYIWRLGTFSRCAGTRALPELHPHRGLEMLSGRIRSISNPGLKPWAIIYSRFAAKESPLTSRHRP
jgi:hypothetical protein